MDLKVEPIVRTSCTLAAQLMASNEENTENLEIYCKQYSCELNHLDEIFKTITYKRIENQSGCHNTTMIAFLC